MLSLVSFDTFYLSPIQLVFSLKAPRPSLNVDSEPKLDALSTEAAKVAVKIVNFLPKK